MQMCVVISQALIFYNSHVTELQHFAACPFFLPFTFHITYFILKAKISLKNK